MEQDEKTTVFQDIPLSKIVLNKYNARDFEGGMTEERKASFESLVNSIRIHGVLQPVLVRPVNSHYEVIAGERRVRAARRILKTDQLSDMVIPATVREADDDDAYSMMTAENWDREDLSPFEQAKSFDEFLKKHGNTDDALMELSSRAGIPPHVIRHKVALLSLPVEIVNAWQKDQITQAHVEQFMRLSDEREKCLKLLTSCIRDRLTVRELRDAIFRDTPELKHARFDTTKCQTCQSNSGLQHTLFSDNGKAVCLSPKCFTEQQRAYFAENWQTSKAREVFQTNGFRFLHEINPNSVIPIKAEIKDRCRTCPEHLTVVTLQAGIHKGMERVCGGPKDCHAELYLPKPKPKSQEQVEGKKGSEKATASKGSSTGRCSATASTSTCGGKSKDADAQAEKRSARRGLLFMERFLEATLPERIAELNATGEKAVRLAIAALILGDHDVESIYTQTFMGKTAPRKEQVVEHVFGIANDRLLPLLKELAVVPIMNGVAKEEGGCVSYSSNPRVRLFIASQLGVDLEKEFILTPQYLESMTKDEIVKVCESLGLWEDPQVRAYKGKHFPRKALLSLKKSELQNCILKSGAELKGRTPVEVIQASKK